MPGRFTTFLWRAAQSGLGRLKYPYRMNFAVTKECHSKCGHCSIWKSGRRTGELSLEEILQIARSYPHLSWLSLTGGEPTDRADLPGIAEAFFRNSRSLYLLNFSTNGLNRKRILAQVKEILKLGIPKVMVAVSIDGPKEIHDHIRGIPGGFERAAETLRDLLALSESRRGFHAFASMTLYPENASHAKALFPGLLPLVPGLKPGNIHFNLGNDEGHLYEKQEKLDFSRLRWEVPRTSAPTASIFQNFLEGSFQNMIPRYLETAKTPIKCVAVESSFHLDERGNLFPCTVWDMPLGNVRDHGYSILKILGAAKASEAKALIKNSRCPQCWSPCEAYQSIAASPVKSAMHAFWPS